VNPKKTKDKKKKKKKGQKKSKKERGEEEREKGDKPCIFAKYKHPKSKYEHVPMMKSSVIHFVQAEGNV